MKYNKPFDPGYQIAYGIVAEVYIPYLQKTPLIREVHLLHENQICANNVVAIKVYGPVVGTSNSRQCGHWIWLELSHPLSNTESQRLSFQVSESEWRCKS